MSKWRPAPECIYVIPDIHGYNDCLDQILSRILPLRPNDQLVFLGDYVDRGPDSDKVLDNLCDLTEKYGDQVTCIMGNHEWLFLASIGAIKVERNPLSTPPINVWLAHGGVNTIKSYCDRAGIEDYQTFQIHRIKKTKRILV